MSTFTPPAPHQEEASSSAHVAKTPFYLRKFDLWHPFIVAVIGLTLFMAVGYAIRPSMIRGDGNEYIAMTEGLVHKRSPEGTPGTGYKTGLDGKSWSIHFFGYPLLSLPARAFTHNALDGFHLTNVLFFFGSLIYAYLHLQFERRKKLIFLALCACSPVLYYLVWTHPECFTWSSLLCAYTAFSRKQYSLASLFASLGAMQNPGLVFIALSFLGVGFYENGFRYSWRSVASLLPAFAPCVFYKIHFGTFNIIVLIGAASWKFITWAKAMSYLFDLNQGFLGCMPVMLVALVGGLYTLFKERERKELILFAGTFVAFLTMITALNWNNDCAGLLRYGVLLLPAFAYIGMRIPLNRFFCGLFVLGFSFQLYTLWKDDGNRSYLEHSPIATFVLNRFPAFYNPVPEIFIERTMHKDGYVRPEPGHPVVYEDLYGRKRKALTYSPKEGYGYINYPLAPLPKE